MFLLSTEMRRSQVMTSETLLFENEAGRSDRYAYEYGADLLFVKLGAAISSVGPSPEVLDRVPFFSYASATLSIALK